MKEQPGKRLIIDCLGYIYFTNSWTELKGSAIGHPVRPAGIQIRRDQRPGLANAHPRQQIQGILFQKKIGPVIADDMYIQSTQRSFPHIGQIIQAGFSGIKDEGLGFIFKLKSL
jgi:hypothetical protein